MQSFGRDELGHGVALLQEGLRLSDLQIDRAPNIDRAIELFRDAAALFLRRGDEAQFAVAQYELGLAYHNRINGERSANLLAATCEYGKALQVFTLENAPEQFSMVVQNMAAAHGELAERSPLDEHHLDNSIEMYEKALTAHAYSESPADWASTAKSLARRYAKRRGSSDAESIEQAIDLETAALGVFTAGAAGLEEARALWSPTNRRWNQRLVELAPTTQHSLQEGEERYTRLNFLRDRANTLASLADTLCLRLKGDRARNLEDALTRYIESVKILNGLNDAKSSATVANNLAVVYQQRVVGNAFENWSRSVHYFRIALQLHQRSGAQVRAAQTAQNLAATLIFRAHTFPERPRPERGADLEEAINLLKEALKVRTKEDFPYQWAMTTSMLAAAHQNRIDGDRRENLEESIRLYTAAAEVDLQATPIDRWKLLSNLGTAYLGRISGNRLENLAIAVTYLTEAVQGLTAAGLVDLPVSACQQLAAALIELNRTDEALNVVSQMIDRLEAMRARSEFASMRRHLMSYTNALVDIVIGLYWNLDTRESLRWSENARGRALAEALMRTKRPPQGVSESDYASYLQNKAARDSLERGLRGVGSELLNRPAVEYALLELQATITQTESRYAKADPSWSNLLPPPHLQDLLEAATHADANILVLRVTENGTYAWVLTPDRAVVGNRFEQPTTSSLRKFLVGTEDDRESGWLSAYVAFKNREQTFAKWLDAMDRGLEAIWRDWLGEIHAFASRHTIARDGLPRLIIVPSQSLASVPLHAARRLVDGRVRYWCDDFVISYAPTLPVLSESLQRRRAAAARGLLAVGNPQGNLHWSLPEVEAVAARFSDEEKDIFGPPGNNRGLAVATVENVKQALARSHRLVLLSCHGKWDALDPWSGAGFFLSGAESRPNLPLEALLNGRLSGCDLAVLSACESGLTEPTDPAEEYIGLPAALIVAGAASVIASLWSVDDVSTALLVMYTLKEANNRELFEPAAQLHNAQLWLRTATLKEVSLTIESLAPTREIAEKTVATLAERGDIPFSHPFWWAAFTCIGSP
jgi:CHAT domain-containing protein/tetratricopeptide (TPR) repeat protein